jgi:predicted DNA-binding transcriptional regulator AlpA
MKGTSTTQDEIHGGTVMERTAGRLWGVQDVATYLGVPVMTIYHWRRTGYGPKGTRVGRYVRYRPDDVRAWFDRQYREAG